MKNIKIIDDADNCTYSIYEISDEQFSVIFPNEADVEFVEDLEHRLGREEFEKISCHYMGKSCRKEKCCGYSWDIVLWSF
jgi:hypothetical protein